MLSVSSRTEIPRTENTPELCGLYLWALQTLPCLRALSWSLYPYISHSHTAHIEFAWPLIILLPSSLLSVFYESYFVLWCRSSALKICTVTEAPVCSVSKTPKRLTAHLCLYTEVQLNREGLKTRKSRRYFSKMLLCLAQSIQNMFFTLVNIF